MIKEKNRLYKEKHPEEDPATAWEIGTFTVSYEFPDGNYDEIELDAEGPFVIEDNCIIFNNADVDNLLYCLELTRIFKIITN